MRPTGSVLRENGIMVQGKDELEEKFFVSNYLVFLLHIEIDTYDSYA